MKNKFFSLILTICIMTGFTVLIPPSASAATVGKCGDNLIYILEDEGTLTIIGTGDIKYQPWHSSRSKIKNIIIEEGITSIIGFGNCTNLTNISIPDTVTSIGSFAFSGCTNLININIPDSVTSICSSAFYDTGYYNNSDNWTDNVLYIGNYLIEAKDIISGDYKIKPNTKLLADFAFDFCSGLTSITIPDSVISIGQGVFLKCRNLTSIKIDENNNNYSSLDGNLFNKNYTSLIQYAIGKRESSYVVPDSVTSIGYASFSGCTNLTSISIPDSITSIGDRAFDYCLNLTNIIIPDGVTSIGDHTFSSCTRLTSINIPDNVTSIAHCAFAYCTRLTNITIPDSVISIGLSAFFNCYSLTSIKIDENNNNYSSLDGNLFNKNYTSLIQYAIGKRESSYVVPDSVTSIRSEAFSGCNSLINITIPKGVTSIGFRTFCDCTNLASITIPDSVISIGSDAFDNCPNLTDVYYTGSREEWNNINIANSNEPLTNATIHYNYISNEATEMKTISVDFGETTKRWHFDIEVEDFAEEATIYVGLYDQERKLLSLTTEALDTEDITTLSITKNPNTAYAKVFVWKPSQQAVTLSHTIEDLP